MTDGKQYKPVFISYSNEDKAVAYKVCAILESRDLSCWIAPRDVPPGSKWAVAISDAIDRTNALVLIFSEHANKSQAIVSEVDQAFSNGIPVFPVRIKNVEPSRELKFRIRAAHWVDAFTPPIEQEINRLADSIHSLLGTQQEQETYHGSVSIRKPVEYDKPPKRMLKWIFAIAAACVVIAGLFLLHRQPAPVEIKKVEKSINTSVPGYTAAPMPPKAAESNEPNYQPMNTKVASLLDEAADYANRGYLEQARKLVTEVIESDPCNEKAKTLLSEIDGRIKSKNENDKKSESKKLWY
jgi:hypothetical protein